MASQPDTPEAAFLNQLIQTRNRSLSLFFPFILGFASDSPTQNSDRETAGTAANGRLLLINPLTPSLIVIEGPGSLDTLLGHLSSKEGPLPATKASIDAMPMVEVTEEVAGECAICLDEWKVGEKIKEMPCKHSYHSGCIEKWLGVHGTCPVCRFKMPVDEDEQEKKARGGEVWFSFTINRNNSTASDSNQADSGNFSSNSSRDVEEDRETSTQDMEQ